MDYRGLSVWPRGNRRFTGLMLLMVCEAYLPPTASPAVIGKGVADPGVDVIQTQLPVRGGAYRHGDERGVAVGGLPLGAGGRRRGRAGREVSPLPPPVLFPLLLSSSPLLPRTQTAHS